MGSYYSVAPPYILERMKAEGVLGSKHLLLAHDVVRRPQEYRNLFHALVSRDPGMHIIMDNSAYELKSSVDTNMVKEAVDAIGGRCCVVLPDHYLDSQNTMLDTLGMATEWHDIFVRQRNCTLMAIPQGETFERWVWCAEMLADHIPGVHYWGCPRNVKEVLHVSRRDAVSVLVALNSQRRIHLFGMSDDYIDDLISAHHHYHVVGIDSTTPIRAGSLGYNFNLSLRMPPRGDWWETAEWSDLITFNLSLARRYWR